MKFRRSHRFLGGQLDAAPFAGVFVVLLIFVALNTFLVFTPGVPIRLPAAVDLSGTPNPTVVVAVDAVGNLYFDNQITTEEHLRDRLRAEVRQSREPLTLVIEADKDVKHEKLVRLALLASQLGIKDALLATRPQLTDQLRPEPTPPK